MPFEARGESGKEKKRGFVPRAPAPPDMTDRNAEAFAGAATERFLGNAAGIPASILKGLTNSFLSVPPGIERMSANAGIETPQELVNPMLDKMQPEGRDIVSAAESFLLPGVDFDQVKEKRTQIADQNPVLDMLGTLTGDASTLFAGRAPVKKAIERDTGKTAGGLFDEAIDTGLNKIAGKAAPGRSTGLRREIQEVVDSETFRTLARGLGRSAETGLEAGVLTSLQGGDPAEVAGIAAGMQTVSSLALTGGSKAVEMPFKLFGAKPDKVTKFTIGTAVQGVLLASLFQVFQQDPDQASETAYDKITFGLVSAMALGLPGKRTKDDGLLKNFPLLADGILSAPRAAMINGAQAVSESPNAQQVVQTMSTQPYLFTGKESAQATKALEAGTFVEWAEEIYQKKFADVEKGLSPEVAVLPAKKAKRRDRGPGFTR